MRENRVALLLRYSTLVLLLLNLAGTVYVLVKVERLDPQSSSDLQDSGNGDDGAVPVLQRVAGKKVLYLKR